ncbi:alpha/beta-hydrolase [Atractiella rhizophila]|nr:alpha/beta-hydrolase [Atractiella rhizophila]
MSFDPSLRSPAWSERSIGNAALDGERRQSPIADRYARSDGLSPLNSPSLNGGMGGGSLASSPSTSPAFATFSNVDALRDGFRGGGVRGTKSDVGHGTSSSSNVHTFPRSSSSSNRPMLPKFSVPMSTTTSEGVDTFHLVPKQTSNPPSSTTSTSSSTSSPVFQGTASSSSRSTSKPSSSVLNRPRVTRAESDAGEGGDIRFSSKGKVRREERELERGIKLARKSEPGLRDRTRQAHAQGGGSATKVAPPLPLPVQGPRKSEPAISGLGIGKRPSLSLKRTSSRSSGVSGVGSERRLSGGMGGLMGRLRKRQSSSSVGGGSTLSVDGTEESAIGQVREEDVRVLASLFVGPDATGPGAISVTNMDRMVESLRDTALSPGAEESVKKVRRREREREKEEERRREEEKKRLLGASSFYSGIPVNGAGVAGGKEVGSSEDEEDFKSLFEKRRKRSSAASSNPTTVSSKEFPPSAGSAHIPLPYVLKDDLFSEDLTQSPPSVPSSPSPVEEKKPIPTLDSLLKARTVGGVLPSPPLSTVGLSLHNSPAPEKKSAIPSLEEILSRHSPANPMPPIPSISRGLAGSGGRTISGHISEEEEGGDERVSLDSVTEEVVRAARLGVAVDKRVHHSKSFPSRPSPGMLNGSDKKEEKRQHSHDLQSTPSLPPKPSLSSNPAERKIAEYLRSPRLTRLLKLTRPPNQKVTVSLCDLGRKDGHPVLVFLGLGGVRYLVGLYDEMADALGLRLVCVDRWGLGRTTEVDESKRGFLEWASVIEEVVDQLDIGRFSILAHSAGAPYALACSLRMDARIVGSIHLLAPWVGLTDLADSAEGAGGYKWLKFVPNGVIKTAQAAEWKVTSWKLGKAPKLAVEGVGFDKAAPVAWNKESTSFDSSDYDQLSDIGSRFSQEVQERWADGSTGGVKRSKLFGGLFEAKKPTPQRRNTSSPRSGLRNSPLPSTEDCSPPPSISPRTSFNNRPPSLASSSNAPYEPPPAQDIGTALLQASHAESLKGGTADLLAILGKNGRPFGFKYSQVNAEVKVWHGDRDEKIPLSSIRWMEREMLSCTVNVVQGADHSLMTNPKVMVEALESIAEGC